MTGHLEPIPVTTPPDDTRRERACLRCGLRFGSLWAGERICGRCKGSAAWRNGAPSRGAPPMRAPAGPTGK